MPYIACTIAWWFRVSHWVLAFSTVSLLISGLTILDAAPIFGFAMPTLPNSILNLAYAIQVHLFCAWTFIASLATLLISRIFGLGSAPKLSPIGVWRVLKDIKSAFFLKLEHKDDDYNHAQRLIYLCVYLLLLISAISGIGIWKPVQFQLIFDPIGGFELLRIYHFLCMVFVIIYIVVHLIMALSAPRLIIQMIFGFHYRSERSPK